MANHNHAIARLISSLNIKQVETLLQTCSLSELAIIERDIMPLVDNFSARRAVRHLIHGMAPPLDSAPQGTDLNCQTSEIYHRLINQQLAKLNNQSLALFLQQISEIELYALYKYSQSQTMSALNQAILKAWHQRDANLKATAMASYKVMQNQPGTTTNPPLVTALTKIESVYQQYQAQMKDKRLEKPLTWFEWFLSFFIDINIKESSQQSIINQSQPAIADASQPDLEPQKPLTYQATLSDKDLQLFEQMRRQQAQYSKQVSGESALKAKSKRTISERQESIKSRFGFILSSQMVAGTATDHHHDVVRSIAESLALEEDNDEAMAEIYDSIADTIAAENDAILYSLFDKLKDAEPDQKLILNAVDEVVPESLPESIKSQLKSIVKECIKVSITAYQESGSSESSHFQSLLQTELNDKLNEFYAAFEERPLASAHIFSAYGDDTLLSSIESGSLSRILGDPQKFQAYGLDISKQEVEKINEYQQSLSRSQDINHAINTFSFEWGGYQRDDEHGYKRVDDPSQFAQAQKSYLNKLEIVSKKLVNACAKLSEGQSLMIDTGLEGHAMKISIKRVGNEFKLSCYDSSGAIENSFLQRGGLFGFYELYQMGSTAKRKNGISFNISADKLVSEKGLDYFKGIIRRHSYAGWAEGYLEEGLRHSTREERERAKPAWSWKPWTWPSYIVGMYNYYQSLSKQGEIYSKYVEKFTAISDKEPPFQFEDTLQYAQNTSNCFAKRLLSCELYELGKPTYKKVRTAMLLDQRTALLADIKGQKQDGEKDEVPLLSIEYSNQLESLKPRILSPDEIHQASLTLSEIKSTPEKKEYIKLFSELRHVKQQMLAAGKAEDDIAISRIEQKLKKHTQLFFNYLNKNKSDNQQKIDQYFSLSEDGKEANFNWQDQTATEALAEFAAGQAWLAAFKLINHQISKNLINERYINNQSERLTEIGFRSALSKVTLADLEGANIVCFATGFTRKQNIKIELNIDGQRREISKSTFFNLIKNVDGGLTSNKVMPLINYLRNFSKDLEHRYKQEVYPAQRQAFNHHLNEKISQCTSQLATTVNDLNQQKQRYEIETEQLAAKISDLEDKLNKSDKRTPLADKNLQSQLALLNTEKQTLENLQSTITIKIGLIEACQAKIDNAASFHRQLSQTNSPLQSITDCVEAFSTANKLLAEVEHSITSEAKELSLDKLENALQTNNQAINNYRTSLIRHHLLTKADYQLLEPVALGNMGTEADRNSRLYQQDEAARNQFYQGQHPSFKEGSVYDKIQKLSLQLQQTVIDNIDQQILMTNNQQQQRLSIAKLTSSDSHQQTIAECAKELTKAKIDQNLKDGWISDMFKIFLEHTSSQSLAELQTNNEESTHQNILQAFQKFIRHHTDIDIAALTTNGFNTQLSLSQIKQYGWQTIDGQKLKDEKKEKEHAVELIGSKLQPKVKLKAKPLKDKAPSSTPYLSHSEIHALHTPDSAHYAFMAPDIHFLSQSDKESLDNSTIKFLLNNPEPKLDDNSAEAIIDYHLQVSQHLAKLSSFQGLENKTQRIQFYCYKTINHLFNIDAPNTIDEDILKQFSSALLEPYQNEQGQIDEKSFLMLENNERIQLLRALLQLNLASLDYSSEKQTAVNPNFYSTIKQWRNLLQASDPKIDAVIDGLTPDGQQPLDMTVINSINLALHKSPVSLEGLAEGQKGLQAALAAFEEPSSKLRALANKLYMRNGESLLASQLMQYYDNEGKHLPDECSLHSSTGRELFTRAFIDAFSHASDADKLKLLTFLDELILDEGDSLAEIGSDEQQQEIQIESSPQIMRNQLFIKCATLDPSLYQKAIDQNIAQSVNSHADMVKKAHSLLISTANIDGSLRLFGFSQLINQLSLEIEYQQVSPSSDTADNLQKLYAQLICAKLAYQLLYDKLSDDVIASINHNFEFKKTIAQAQTNINNHQQDINDYCQSLNNSKQADIFSECYQYFQSHQMFEGKQVPISTVKAKQDLVGFIDIGNNRSLDVLNGVIYIGNNKLDMMPAHIDANIEVEELKLSGLPFKAIDGGYEYKEHGEVKATITPLANGDLVLQRALTDITGQAKMMQYVSPDKMNSLPAAIKNKLNAEHFFIDENNQFHAFDNNFNPVLMLSPDNQNWHGTFIDHQGKKERFEINNQASSTTQQALSRILPNEEIISINSTTFYIAALKKYIIASQSNDGFIICDSLANTRSAKQLSITEANGHFIASIERRLSETEQKEIDQLQTELDQIEQDKQHYLSTTKQRHQSGIVHQNKLDTFSAKAMAIRYKINALKSPEVFTFAPESALVKENNLAVNDLRAELKSAYIKYLSATIDKEQQAEKYESLKQQYLAAKAALVENKAAENGLLSYDVDAQGHLQPSSLCATLHLAKINKMDLLIHRVKDLTLQAPLSQSELAELKSISDNLLSQPSIDHTNSVALALLLSLQVQHHVQQRKNYITSRASSWDQQAYQQTTEQLSSLVSTMGDTFPKEIFIEPWREIQSEFRVDDPISKAMYMPPHQAADHPLPIININSHPSRMPIENLEQVVKVSYQVHQNIEQLIDDSQAQLEQRLAEIDINGANEQQRQGYYYENYGLFNLTNIERLLRVDNCKAGVAGLSKSDVADLYNLFKGPLGWIKPVTINGSQMMQINGHPSEFYSKADIAAQLSAKGYSNDDIDTISNRLEVFLYQTAELGGKYTITPAQREKLLKQINQKQQKYQVEALLAQNKIDSILAQSPVPISQADLNAAYLLNDFQKILSHFPVEQRQEIEKILNNSITRLLFYKTELDHINDINSALNDKKDSKALSLLHIKRNYSLNKLLSSSQHADSKSLSETKLYQQQKMQKAFLLFESQFGHRCNARQVEIFRGLLLDNDNDPDKIDAAQARMGFGKTTLLPLVALYKTGNQLVRFIVPKSARETNAADMSKSLKAIFGSRAIIDDFSRYKIDSDPQEGLLEKSPRLIALLNAKRDLQKRLELYKNVQANNEVLVQSPNVRNALECQAKIFLDMVSEYNNELYSAEDELIELDDNDAIHMADVTDDVKTKRYQFSALMSCIKTINEIRNIPSLSVFDELDDTQNAKTTDVNFTAGGKENLDIAEIRPLEKIADVIKKSAKSSTSLLANELLAAFDHQVNSDLINYLTDKQAIEPTFIDDSYKPQIYLIRAILTDPNILKIYTEKQPNTDFGVWFETDQQGIRQYDYDALGAAGPNQTQNPLLIAIPYAFANTPKPKGSRFDNPEVTAITTLLYYQSSTTTLHDQPHMTYLINAFKQGLGELPYKDEHGQTEKSLINLLADIKTIAELEDPVVLAAARSHYFNKTLPQKFQSGEISESAFRTLLARTIIQDQVKFDRGKANSNRYEQGNIHDRMIGFSGTAGDPSSYFERNQLDPAADGNMTLGIMGRGNNQTVSVIPDKAMTNNQHNYNQNLIKEFAKSFNKNTRTIIDVGGLCKCSNFEAARLIALSLKNHAKVKNIKGVIFYDDISNTKKVLSLTASGSVIVMPLSDEIEANSNSEGNYFTFYDQSHSRGADIKQMDDAHALLTFSHTVTNNDYKQAIMRMRKIISKSDNGGQSFSTIMPQEVQQAIIKQLSLSTNKLSGNDIAFWLRSNELADNNQNTEALMMEMDAIVKNAILQQQADITALLDDKSVTGKQMVAYKNFIHSLNNISQFITNSTADLKQKYGLREETMAKDKFIDMLQTKFKKDMELLLAETSKARANMSLPALADNAFSYYWNLQKSILDKRQPTLPEQISIPKHSSALSDVQSSGENQNESQSQSQSQSEAQNVNHSCSEVSRDEVDETSDLNKINLPFCPVTLEFLESTDSIERLSLASQLPALAHIFNDTDQVKCSPSYLASANWPTGIAHPTPPVRYILARESGNPAVILINQDEADLFYKSKNTEWALYDLSYQKGRQPLVDKEVIIEPILFKKLQLSAYHCQIHHQSLSEIARSLEGIVTADDLQPTVEIVQDSPDKPAIFTPKQLGFAGSSKVDFKVSTATAQPPKSGTVIQFSAAKDDEHQVYISDKLNRRILEAKKDSTASPKQSVIAKVASEIEKDYQAARDKKVQLGNAIRDNKKLSSKTAKTHDKIINDLTKQKEQLVKHHTDKLIDSFNSHAKQQLNAKEFYSGYLAERLYAEYNHEEDSREQWRLNIDDHPHASINSAIQYYIQQFINIPNANVDGSDKSQQQHLERNIDLMLQKLVSSIEQQYKKDFRSAQQQSTFLEQFMSKFPIKPSQQQRNQPPSSGKKKQNKWQPVDYQALQRGNLPTVFGSKDFDSDLDDQIAYFYYGGDATFKFIKSCFETAYHACSFSPEQFEQRLLAELKKAPDEIIEKNGEAFAENIMDALSYAPNSTSSYKSLIKDYVLNEVQSALSLADEAHLELHQRAMQVVEQQMSETAISVPDELFRLTNLDDIRQVVNQAFQAQSMRTTPYQVEKYTKETESIIKAHHALLAELNNYKPKQNRSPELSLGDGSSFTIPAAIYQELAALDNACLEQEFDRKIEEAQQAKQTALAKLEGELIELRADYKAHLPHYQKLKEEKSAMRQLLSSIKELFNFFSTKLIHFFDAPINDITTSQCIEVADDCLDIVSAIEPDIDSQTTLSIVPPQIYHVNDNMISQKESMHGLTSTEETAGATFNAAMTKVKQEAALVTDRDVLLNGKHLHHAKPIPLSTQATIEIDLVPSPLSESLSPAQLSPGVASSLAERGLFGAGDRRSSASSANENLHTDDPSAQKP